MGRYSSDEGEIRDSGLEKATTSSQNRDSAVDRQSRPHHSRYSPSPSLSVEDSVTAALRRSSDSDVAPRGSKRYHVEDHYARSRDPRRFKVHYEDRPDHRRRRQDSYDDLDRTGHAPSKLPYDDRDAGRGFRSRTRSRSPYRAPREKDVRGGNYGHNSHHNDRRGGRQDVPDRSRMNGHGGGYQALSSRQQSVSKGGDKPVPADDKSRDAKTIQGSSQQLDDNIRNGSSTEK